MLRKVSPCSNCPPETPTLQLYIAEYRSGWARPFPQTLLLPDLFSDRPPWGPRPTGHSPADGEGHQTEATHCQRHVNLRTSPSPPPTHNRPTSLQTSGTPHRLAAQSPPTCLVFFFNRLRLFCSAKKPLKSIQKRKTFPFVPQAKTHFDDPVNTIAPPQVTCLTPLVERFPPFAKFDPYPSFSRMRRNKGDLVLHLFVSRTESRDEYGDPTGIFEGSKHKKRSIFFLSCMNG